MPGLEPGIHVLLPGTVAKLWMAGGKPGHDGQLRYPKHFLNDVFLAST